MKTFKHLGMLVMLAFVFAAMTACSDNDEPKPDPNPDDQDLISIPYIVSKQPLCGLPDPYGVNMYITFMSSNKHEWLKDIPWFENKFKTSDWYFEFNGKQYRYGDVVDTLGNTKPIQMVGLMNADKFTIRPVDIDWEKLKESPIRYSYKFMWPSRNIGHTIEVYAVYNQNFEKDKAEKLASLGEDEVGTVELYKIGFWIDGKPMESPWKQSGIFTIYIEE